MNVRLSFRKLYQNGFDHILSAVAFVVILGIIGTGYIVIHGHNTKGVSHAVSNGNQFCGAYGCLNAWNGGPWVQQYPNAGAGNNDFFSHSKTDGQATYMKDVGANPWNGRCLGDSYNQPDNSSVSLDECPDGFVNGGGWGTHFHADTTHCSSGSIAFKNDHWGKYLHPGSSSSSNSSIPGAHFYLNGNSPYCFRVL